MECMPIFKNWSGISYKNGMLVFQTYKNLVKNYFSKSAIFRDGPLVPARKIVIVKR